MFGSKNSFVYLFFLPLVRIVRACPFNESFFHLDSYCTRTVLHIESVQLENAKTFLREGQSWQLSGRRKETNLARMPPTPPLTRTMGGQELCPISQSSENGPTEGYCSETISPQPGGGGDVKEAVSRDFDHRLFHHSNIFYHLILSFFLPLTFKQRGP